MPILLWGKTRRPEHLPVLRSPSKLLLKLRRMYHSVNILMPVLIGHGELYFHAFIQKDFDQWPQNVNPSTRIHQYRSSRSALVQIANTVKDGFHRFSVDITEPYVPSINQVNPVFYLSRETAVVDDIVIVNYVWCQDFMDEQFGVSSKRFDVSRGEDHDRSEFFVSAVNIEESGVSEEPCCSRGHLRVHPLSLLFESFDYHLISLFWLIPHSLHKLQYIPSRQPKVKFKLLSF